MSLVEPAVSGIVFGFIISIMVGPVFFTLIQTSLQEGFKAGSHLAFGVMLSDAAFIAFSYLFASQINLEGSNKGIVGLIGGIVLIGFAIYQATKKIKIAEINQPARAIHARYTIKGFLMNAANPSVFLFWLTLVGQVKIKEHYEYIHEWCFFSVCLVTVFAIDLGKSYAAHRVKNILKPHLLHWINYTIGAILFGYGVWMIGKGYGWWAKF